VTTDLFERVFALDAIEITRSGDGRTVEAYAAVFDQPAEVLDTHGHYMEVISPGAFDKTIAERGTRVGVFYNHGMTVHGTPSDLGSVPIGSPREIVADGRGLRTITRYNRSALADSVLEAIRNGDIRGQSFRGRIFQSTPAGRAPRGRPGDPLPTITRTELGLREYGPTPEPVYVGAEILAVRSAAAAAQLLADLPADERAELLRMLASTTPTGPETPPATPDTGAGAEGPHLVHPGRQADLVRRIRRAALVRGMR
jgi:HK97 family phage prohead protease